MKLPACAVALALVVGTASGPVSFAAQKSSVTPGIVVRVGDHGLYLSCSGATGSGPAIILEAGGGGTSADWSQVRDLLGSELRTCAYDRAGLGRSEPGPLPRTMRQEVFELHLLLGAADVKPPYVFVGQSIGGLLARLYVEAFPADVAGVVLVDPAHEDGMFGSLRYGGWVRLREKAIGRAVPEPRRSRAGGPPADPEADYMAEEFQQIFVMRQKVPQPLGQRPLIVLAAGRQEAPPPGTSEELWRTLRGERDEQVANLASLSTNAKFVRDLTSGHNIHRDNPSLVAVSIKEVREAAMRGTRLEPVKP